MRVSSSSVGRQAMKLPNLIFVCIQILAKICIIKKVSFYYLFDLERKSWYKMERSLGFFVTMTIPLTCQVKVFSYNGIKEVIGSQLERVLWTLIYKSVLHLPLKVKAWPLIEFWCWWWDCFCLLVIKLWWAPTNWKAAKLLIAQREMVKPVWSACQESGNSAAAIPLG